MAIESSRNNSARSLIVASVWTLLIVAAAPSYTRPLTLEFYIHYYVGENIIPVAPAPSNATSFGLVEAMDLPMTVTEDPNSTLLGAERCLGSILHDSPGYRGDMHVCTFTYDDGVYTGRFNMHGESNTDDLSRWEFAVTGGTGDFRGAQGYGVGSILASNATYAVYRYFAHLYLPDPPMNGMYDI